MTPPPAGSSRRPGWGLLRTAIGAHRGAVLLGVCFGLVWTAAKVAVPALTRLAVDRGIIADRQGELLKWSLAIVAVGIVSAAATGIRRYVAFGIALRTETELRLRL